MAKDSIGTQIETLIHKSEWKQARIAIERQLDKEPDDHWLWSRLSGVMYEQRDYQGALKTAEKALSIISDCPLALWSKAGALDMLGKADKASESYLHLFRRGLEELRNPDEDANECWEGPDWTYSLIMDCIFRIAGCLTKTDRLDTAVDFYQEFLSLLDLGPQGIYSRQDAEQRLNKLVEKKAKRQVDKKAKRDELLKKVEKKMEKELVHV